MNTNILFFNHPDFGQVRVVTNRKGKPLFVAEDVAKALGFLHTENAISSYCKGGSILPISTPDCTQEVKFIKKRDLYRLVVGSNFPQAEEFRCWVEDAIVPFVSAMSELVVGVESVINSMVSILQEVEEEENNKALIEEEQECDRAKIVFADAVIASVDNMSIDDLATMLKLNGVDIDEDGLLRWMRENDYLCTK